uniref:cytosine deaminase n=1 Tax=Pararhizobium sp. IMCC3301 TaxID=3067904 RepID=UPI0027426F4B|nr:cytosine deaminase [Pararhizobium sp. IMCC3301]
MASLPGFITIPKFERYALSHGRVPAALVAHLSRSQLPKAVFPPDDDLVCADFLIEEGQLAAIGAPGAFDGEVALLNLDDAIVLPAFTELHTHLDKGHIWPRQANPDGSFGGALDGVSADRTAHWSAEDVRARMEFSLRCAYAHGTRSIRTHLDSIAPQHQISWPIFAELRSQWQGRIALQAVSLVGIDGLADDAVRRDLLNLVLASGGIAGAVTYMVPELEATLDKMIREAIDAGIDIDFHVDETLDPAARSLAIIAERAIALGYEGKITCGHCCSLSRQTPDEVDRTLDLVARANITVVSLPLCNLYLQDRGQAGAAPRTPRFRGVTLLHEMKARGIPVAVSSDNTRDPFYAYGDLDALEVYREATRIAHLDHPVGEWIKTITETPAAAMRLEGGFSIGGAADMVLVRARSFNELLSRPQTDRVVLRSGAAIERVLPDYRELDGLLS